MNWSTRSSEVFLMTALLSYISHTIIFIRSVLFEGIYVFEVMQQLPWSILQHYDIFITLKRNSKPISSDSQGVVLQMADHMFFWAIVAHLLSSSWA
jgi:hypothetical protein